MGISIYPPATSGGKVKRVEIFYNTGSWTAPAGVDYVIAHAWGGGGGGGGFNTDGNAGGSTSFVGDSSIGVGHPGGRPGGRNVYAERAGFSGPNFTGQGGSGCGTNTTNGVSAAGESTTAWSNGAPVTPGTSYTVTIGAGGNGGANSGGNGGSGRLELEYYVDA